jgi:hypothetical protein
MFRLQFNQPLLANLLTQSNHLPNYAYGYVDHSPSDLKSLRQSEFIEILHYQCTQMFGIIYAI